MVESRSFEPSQSEPEPEDRPELEAAYRTHGRWLVDFLRRRFGHEAAEDLAQETYLRLARSGAGPRNPRALMAITALNAARDQGRRRKARPRLVGDENAMARESYPANQAEALLLKQVVLSLPHNLRVVFLLSRFAGLTYEEIARHCGISIKTVEERMSKALAICAAHLRN